MTRGCALVTGGARGIGAATAIALGKAGYPTVILCREDLDAAQKVVATIETGGGQAICLCADIVCSERVEAAFDEIEQAFGPVAVLVNNAGIRADGLAADMSDDEWQGVLSVNLSGAFRCTRRALKPMLRARWGRIINVSSVVAFRGNPGQVNYAASKGGLIAMTRTLAIEVARRNVTVNAVAPGFVPTRLTAGVDPQTLGAIPARRAGTPEDVAACVAFLASEEAGYVTGATLPVDGGLTA